MPDLRRHLRPRAAKVGLGAALGSVLALSVLTNADASSHREAPLITEDPAADNTDLYAFVSSDAPDSVTLISNFIPFQEPGGGPNYFRFGDDVLYEIHVDNDGDAEPNVTYEFRFTTTTVDPNTYQYATGTIDSIDDADWNRPQTYTVHKVEDGQRTLVGTDLLTPPVNVGARTTPNYEALAAEAVQPLVGGGRVFAGQRDENFNADIAAIFDLGFLRPFGAAYQAAPAQAAPGIDTFAGYNVSSIALQIPKSEVVGDDPVIGVWSTASRRKVRVFAPSSASPVHRGQWTQVSRLGMPLVNEVVIPLKLKDAFNTLRPSQDAGALAGATAEPLSTEGDIPLVQDPILAAQIEALYGIEVPPAPRNDLVSVYLTGIEGVNQPANVTPAEMLRLNTSVAPTPLADQNRLGFLGGDMDGFPNGRRLIDDVIDISLRAVAGGYPLTPDFNEAPNNALGDGVDGNDRTTLGTFPYLATPHQGTELNNPGRVGG